MTDHSEISAIVGYSEAFAACETLVAAASHPKLGAAALLDIALRIALTTCGRPWLEATLKEAMRRLPEAEAQATRRLS